MEAPLHELQPALVPVHCAWLVHGVAQLPLLRQTWPLAQHTGAPDVPQQVVPASQQMALAPLPQEVPAVLTQVPAPSHSPQGCEAQDSPTGVFVGGEQTPVLGLQVPAF